MGLQILASALAGAFGNLQQGNQRRKEEARDDEEFALYKQKMEMDYKNALFDRKVAMFELRRAQKLDARDDELYPLKVRAAEAEANAAEIRNKSDQLQLDLDERFSLVERELGIEGERASIASSRASAAASDASREFSLFNLGAAKEDRPHEIARRDTLESREDEDYEYTRELRGNAREDRARAERDAAVEKALDYHNMLSKALEAGYLKGPALERTQKDFEENFVFVSLALQKIAEEEADPEIMAQINAERQSQENAAHDAALLPDVVSGKSEPERLFISGTGQSILADMLPQTLVEKARSAGFLTGAEEAQPEGVVLGDDSPYVERGRPGGLGGIKGLIGEEADVVKSNLGLLGSDPAAFGEGRFKMESPSMAALGSLFGMSDAPYAPEGLRTPTVPPVSPRGLMPSIGGRAQGGRGMGPAFDDVQFPGFSPPRQPPVSPRQGLPAPNVIHAPGPTIQSGPTPNAPPPFIHPSPPPPPPLQLPGPQGPAGFLPGPGQTPINLPGRVGPPPPDPNEHIRRIIELLIQSANANRL